MNERKLCTSCKSFTYILTLYVIGHYNPSVRTMIYLRTRFMLCALILYTSGRTYSLTSTPNYRFLRDFFMAILFTFKIFAKYLPRGRYRWNIFKFFVLKSDLGFARKPKILYSYFNLVENKSYWRKMIFFLTNYRFGCRKSIT